MWKKGEKMRHNIPKNIVVVEHNSSRSHGEDCNSAFQKNSLSVKKKVFVRFSKQTKAF